MPRGYHCCPGDTFVIKSRQGHKTMRGIVREHHNYPNGEIKILIFHRIWFFLITSLNPTRVDMQNWYFYEVNGRRVR